MKKILSIIIATIPLFAPIANADDGTMDVMLTGEANGFRHNDKVEKRQITSIKPLDSGDSLIWDFSNVKDVTKERHNVSYRSFAEVQMIENENKGNKVYITHGDSLLLIRQGNTSMLVNYQIPELVMKYPMQYGSNSSCYFYGEGNLGGMSYIRNAGHSSVSADARGTIVTPENDTIKNMLRVHYNRIGTTLIDNNFKRAFDTTKDSSYFSTDSINHWIATDSITHRIETWRWYARGYRYPIIETQKYKIYYCGTPVDSVSTSYYSSPREQEFDIEDDFVNEQIRYADASNEFNNHFNNNRNSTSNGTRSNNKKPGNNRNSDGNGDNSNGNNAIDGLGIELTAPTCEVSPTIVTNSTTVTYSTATPQEIVVSIHNTAGGVMWQQTETTGTGTHSVICPMEAMSAGDYIIITRIGSQIFSHKIVKK